ncbi:MAG TPA: glycosyltransferase family 2 protein [Spirochaetota bacterium]|nr:glycosyltransferase family 2 protein [Spirochaetota bacterium]
MPFTSVIIPTRNRYEILKRAIDSVFAQTSTDYELIVVDDGSTDDTPLIEEEYRGKLKYIRQTHAGVSAARNHGIKVSSSPWIAFLDSDDQWMPDKLRVHGEYLDSLNREERIHQVDEIWIRNGRRVNPRQRHEKRGGWIFPESLHLCLVSPSASIMHRALLQETGGFNERLPACEDYDLWLRISWKERIGYIPQYMVTRYGGHADQLSARYKGMDRFRVYSICGLLRDHHGDMPGEYLSESIQVAMKKLVILQQGAERRNNDYLAETARRVQEDITAGNYSSTAYQDLLEELTDPA